jgi:hypothetical protein
MVLELCIYEHAQLNFLGGNPPTMFLRSTMLDFQRYYAAERTMEARDLCTGNNYYQTAPLATDFVCGIYSNAPILDGDTILNFENL